LQCRQCWVRLGWLERDGVRLIPDELRPEFSVAVDARAAGTDEFGDWRAMYARAARQFDFTDINGYNGTYYLYISKAVRCPCVRSQRWAWPAQYRMTS